MNTSKNTESLDEVLAAYAEASESFDAKVLNDFIQRFSQFKDALNRYAQVQLSSVRASADEISAVELADNEMLLLQSKVLMRLQQLQNPAPPADELNDVVARLSRIKGNRAIRAATIAVFGSDQDGQDDLFLLVIEPPGVKDAPDWFFRNLGNHISAAPEVVRKGIARGMSASAQHFSVQEKPLITEQLSWSVAIDKAITDAAAKRSILSGL
jgi:hypothetical protein